MSSLARRSIRTTAAAAGIAALGVGFAGHALAAPEAPAVPSTDGLGQAPALPHADAVGGVISSVPAAPSDRLADLPDLFSFQAPNVSAAAPEAALLPQVPEAELPEAPEVPSTAELTDGAVQFEGSMGQVNGPTTDPRSFTETNHVGPMQTIDTALMVADLAQRAMAGETVTEGNHID
ncbi:hypothetical protein [Pseudonocardia nigra]|uniref:hypothetical protein n=1 Tax=Pseudonocardia nigra TaxID=1921578 RepID=UPI001C5D7A0F|nr:hypothetical protein [Pseudonocardia nigra]